MHLRTYGPRIRKISRRFTPRDGTWVFRLRKTPRRRLVGTNAVSDERSHKQKTKQFGV